MYLLPIGYNYKLISFVYLTLTVPAEKRTRSQKTTTAKEEDNGNILFFYKNVLSFIIKIICQILIPNRNILKS